MLWLKHHRWPSFLSPGSSLSTQGLLSCRNTLLLARNYHTAYGARADYSR